MTWKKTVFLVTSILYIFYMVFPLFADTFGIPVWLPSIGVVSVMVLLYPGAMIRNKTFWWFVVYAFLLGIYFLLGRKLTVGIGDIPDGKKIIVEYAFILPSICIYCVLIKIKDDSVTERLIKWSTIALFASFIIALPLMLSFNSLREAMSEERNAEVVIAGLPSYSLMHAYTLFLPVFSYAIKAYWGRKQLFAFFAMAVMCFVVYDTFVTTSLFIMMGLLIFTLFYSDHHFVASIVSLVFIGILFYLLYKIGAFVPVIDAVMPAFEGTAVEPKLSDLRESMIVGHITGGSITGRQDYHAISIDSFFNNPLFGTSIVGGHSSLMDRLGGMGLLVGVPFIMMITSFIKSVAPSYETRMGRTFFWVGIVIGLVYLYNKGNWGGEDWLFYLVLMPFGLYVLERNVISTKKRETNES